MSRVPPAIVILGLVLATVLAGCMEAGDVDTDGADGGDQVSAGPSDGTPDDEGEDTGQQPDPGTQTPPPSGGEPSSPPVSGGNETGGGNETEGNLTEYPWGPQAQARVRPGVQVQVGSSVCTSNFLYRSPHNGTYYLGIAAHCVYETIGEEAFLSNAIGVLGDQGSRIGRVVYSSYKELGIRDNGSPVHPHNNDLALIRIDDGMLEHTHPSMKHFGGPVGQVTSLGDIGLGEKLLAHGDTPMRPGPDQLDRLEGYVTGTSSPWLVHAYFVPYTFQGDSGSAVITAEGDAVGVIVSSATVPPAQTGISFLPPMLGFAADHGFPVEVVTWEQFDDGMLPG